MAASLFALVLALASTVPSAQQKPDFTGTWVAISPAEAAGQEQVVKHTTTTLSTGHASSGDGHQTAYKLDGSESRNELTSHGELIVTISKAAWDGDRVVLTSATAYPDGRKAELKQVWSLDSSGRLVVEITQSMNGRPRSMTIVHRRK